MSKSTGSTIESWKRVCVLRKEIREGHMRQQDFAVDLYQIVNPPAENRPFYCDPDEFFAITYATENLRRFCGAVLGRVAGRPDGTSLVNIAQTFGGGKTHALATLYYLCSRGKATSKRHPAVAEILKVANLEDPPTARIAAVSFDRVDWRAGGEVISPDGERRSFRMPWNLIAWQLLGARGIEILKRNEDEPDYYEPPAQSLWEELLREVEKSSDAALILLDEFLMWAHSAASPDPDPKRTDKGPVWHDRLRNFFQNLSLAVASSARSCLVVSLLATDPAKGDEVGREILSRCNAGLNRQAEVQTPVDRGDFAELLRRRMFERFPQGPANTDQYVTAFWRRMERVDPVRARTPSAKEDMMAAYPFHPDLLARLFGKWTELSQFQRTRGILQTFSLALKEAEQWDESPTIGPQVFLPRPGASDELSPSLEKLANDAMNSVIDEKKPDWPTNLRTELPRVREAQATTTLSAREVEAACVTSFLFSQPLGEQAELGELRWLVGSTVELPAMLTAGLLAWSKSSWYLAECESIDPASELPRYWRFGPEPNLNRMHETYKRNALKAARGSFDKLARECRPLVDDCIAAGVVAHTFPRSPDQIDDDATFHLVILGSDFVHASGNAARQEAVDFLRFHASTTDPRTYQNSLLVVTPSESGLLRAEQAIASWLAWGEIKGSEAFKEMKPEQKQTVPRREREAKSEALTCVKDSFELVLCVDADGSVRERKFTMGGESLFSTLSRERDLRIFRENIDPEAILPGGPHEKWPKGQPKMRVGDLCAIFARYPDMPKLVNRKAVLDTIEIGARRGLLALRYAAPGGTAEWFWHSPIEGIAEWAEFSEVWLPDTAKLESVPWQAVTPGSLGGLWPAQDDPVPLSTLCSWFDGNHSFEEQIQPGYPPENRRIPKADYGLVHRAVADAVAHGELWLLFGSESLLGEKPGELQLDPTAALFRPPERLRPHELLPAVLPGGWTPDNRATVNRLYAALRTSKGRLWPRRQFIDVVNDAVNTGVLAKLDPGPDLVDLAADGERRIGLPAAAPPSPAPKLSSTRESTEVTLSLGQLQDFVEDGAAQISKILAGAQPEYAIKIRLGGKVRADLSQANRLLAKIDPAWRFEEGGAE